MSSTIRMVPESRMRSNPYEAPQNSHADAGPALDPPHHLWLGVARAACLAVGVFAVLYTAALRTTEPNITLAGMLHIQAPRSASLLAWSYTLALWTSVLAYLASRRYLLAAVSSALLSVTGAALVWSLIDLGFPRTFPFIRGGELLTVVAIGALWYAGARVCGGVSVGPSRRRSARESA